MSTSVPAFGVLLAGTIVFPIFGIAMLLAWGWMTWYNEYHPIQGQANIRRRRILACMGIMNVALLIPYLMTIYNVGTVTTRAGAPWINWVVIVGPGVLLAGLGMALAWFYYVEGTAARIALSAALALVLVLLGTAQLDGHYNERALLFGFACVVAFLAVIVIVAVTMEHTLASPLFGWGGIIVMALVYIGFLLYIVGWFIGYTNAVASAVVEPNVWQGLLWFFFGNFVLFILVPAACLVFQEGIKYVDTMDNIKEASQMNLLREADMARRAAGLPAPYGAQIAGQMPFGAPQPAFANL